METILVFKVSILYLHQKLKPKSLFTLIKTNQPWQLNGLLTQTNRMY
jgi:hypothetical protein